MSADNRNEHHPIETAPRDRRILVHCDDDWFTAHWKGNCNPSSRNGFYNDADEMLCPSHWVALPSSPYEPKGYPWEPPGRR